MTKYFLILCLAVGCIGGDNTSKFAGQWEYTAGNGTYDCGDSGRGSLSVRVGAVLTLTEIPDGIRATYPGNCPDGFGYDISESGILVSRGDGCSYSAPGVEARLVNTTESSLVVMLDELTEILHQEYVFTYPDDPPMHCRVETVGYGKRKP